MPDPFTDGVTVEFPLAEVNVDALRALTGEPRLGIDAAPAEQAITLTYTKDRSPYRQIVRSGLWAAFPDLRLPPILDPITTTVTFPRVRTEWNADGTVTLTARPTEGEPLDG